MKNKLFLKINFAILILFSALGGFAAEKPDCSDEDVFEKIVGQAKTIQECADMVEKAKNKCDEAVIDTTMGQVLVLAVEKNCVSKIMNDELDKRLLPLKKESVSQFKDEMKLQKNFNSAIDKACDIFNSCEGTVYRISRQSCFLEMAKWRERQAEQINSKTLTLNPPKKGEKADKKISALKDLKEFSKLFCKMPKVVFKDEKIPENCAASVTAAFAKALGPQLRK